MDRGVPRVATQKGGQVVHDDMQFAVVTRITEPGAAALVAPEIVIVFNLEANTGANSADTDHTAAATELCFALSQFASQPF